MHPCRREVPGLVLELICARLRRTPDPAIAVAKSSRNYSALAGNWQLRRVFLLGDRRLIRQSHTRKGKAERTCLWIALQSI